MRLVSLTDQIVTVADRRVAFRRGEFIITEYSHKYSIDGFRAMASAAGFEPVRVWTDERGLFSVHFMTAS